MCTLHTYITLYILYNFMLHGRDGLYIPTLCISLLLDRALFIFYFFIFFIFFLFFLAIIVGVGDGSNKVEY